MLLEAIVVTKVEANLLRMNVWLLVLVLLWSSEVVYKTRSSVSGYRKSEEVQGLGIDAVDAVGCLDHDIMLVTNTNMNVVALHFSTFLSTKLI